jgi:hypothetical protein
MGNPMNEDRRTVMSEHERRLAVAEKAVKLCRDECDTALDIAKTAVAAYNAPLPPNPQLVTDEMLEAAGRVRFGAEDSMRTAIEAAMRESPVIKRAREWRDMAAGVARNQVEHNLFDALDGAGL